MKFLWAPWRMNYILEVKQESCFFCGRSTKSRDRENLVLHHGKYGFVMMNRFPYNNGHLMVVPNRHCLDLETLRENESRDLFHLLRMATRVLKNTLHPHGFNVGINLGRVGGAGEEHLHVHIVPRWGGDTNFMPVLGETKIIPQYLEKTYQILYLGFKNELKKTTIWKGVKQP